MQAVSKIYLDCNATTPVSPEVIAGLPIWANEFGNPSSIHFGGRGPKTRLREARAHLAKALNISVLEIVFNSGGSEGNSTVIRSVVESLKTSPKLTGRDEFVTSTVEHPSVLKVYEYLESLGYKVHRIPVSRSGELHLGELKKVLSSKTALVSIMLANNETGTIFPIKEISKMVHEVGALFHADCVQGLGKIPIDLKDLEVDYATFSAHKFYALKGTGFLFVKKGSPLVPLIRGAQERHRRGGTENTLGISALGEMAKKLSEVTAHFVTLKQMRDEFEDWILSQIPNVTITAHESLRLPNTSSLVISGVDGETLLMNLDIKGFAVSTGAACSSGSPEPSPVLLAMGLSFSEAQSSLRVSLGYQTTLDQMTLFKEELEKIVVRLRQILRQKTLGDSHVDI